MVRMPLILQLLIRIKNCPYELASIPKRLAGYISLHFGIFKGRTAARTERGGGPDTQIGGPLESSCSSCEKLVPENSALKKTKIPSRPKMGIGTEQVVLQVVK